MQIFAFQNTARQVAVGETDVDGSVFGVVAVIGMITACVGGTDCRGGCGVLCMGGMFVQDDRVCLSCCDRLLLFACVLPRFCLVSAVCACIRQDFVYSKKKQIPLITPQIPPAHSILLYLRSFLYSSSVYLLLFFFTLLISIIANKE